jgi:hypothetical protein
MKVTNKFDLPLPLVNMMSKDNYSKGTSQYSVTGLLQPPKVARFREQYENEMEEDVSDMLPLFLGTALHAQFEGVKAHGFVSEERLFTTLDGIEISGAIDAQQTTPEGIILWDYKFTSVWSVMGEKREWVEQLNMYKWLIETVKKKNVIALKVCALLKDFNKHGSNKEDYPKSQICVVDVPMWNSYEAELFVRNRLAMHQRSKVAIEFSEELQPCSDADRWMSETTYAVKKVDRKTAIRVLTNESEALEMATEKKGYVEVRPGEPRRCAGNYCGVAKWCKQYQGEINEFV